MSEEDTVTYLSKVLDRGQVIMRFDQEENLILFLDYWRLKAFKDKDEKPYPKEVSQGPILYVNTFWVAPEWEGKLHWSVFGELISRNADATHLAWNHDKRSDRFFMRTLPKVYGRKQQRSMV